MNIALKPQIEALLRAQVEAGHYASIEAAITAAVLGAPLDPAAAGDLSWAREKIVAADEDITAGRTMSEDNAYQAIERRLGKL